MSAAWPFAKKLPIDTKVLPLWTSWPRGVSEGAEAPQEQLEPHNVVSVVVAAVCPNAATIWGMLGEHKVEIMLDSGSSISLIQQHHFPRNTRYYRLDYDLHQLQVTIFQY